MIKTLWAAINGKKSIAGLIVILVPYFLKMVGVGDIAPDVVDILNRLEAAGVTTAVIGLAHKLIKILAENKG